MRELTHDQMKWETMPCGASLLSTISIGSALFHIDAVRVVNDAQGHQEAFHVSSPPMDEDKAEGCYCRKQFEAAYQVDGDDRFSTVEIDGHEGEFILVGATGK